MKTLQRLVELVLLITARSRCDAFGVGGERLRLPYPFSSTAANTSPRIVDVDPSNRADDAQAGVISSRRSFVAASAATFSAVVTANAAPLKVDAATDCFADCLKNCKLIAPKDPQYCQSNCEEYCAQSDRTDGLSGSVSSAGGEVGILGVNTVVKGEDRPPEVKLPGLDFTSGSGKKLLGY